MHEGRPEHSSKRNKLSLPFFGSLNTKNAGKEIVNRVFEDLRTVRTELLSGEIEHQSHLLTTKRTLCLAIHPNFEHPRITEWNLQRIEDDFTSGLNQSTIGRIIEASVSCPQLHVLRSEQKNSASSLAHSRSTQMFSVQTLISLRNVYHTSFSPQDLEVGAALETCGAYRMSVRKRESSR